MWQYNYSDELYHYGVKGMRWGVRRANRYEAKARRARKSADRWDAKSTKSASAGKGYRSAMEKGEALKKRALADSYENAAKKLKLKANTPLSELEQYKKSQRTKNIIKGATGTVAVGALAVAAAPAIMVGVEFCKWAWNK